MDIDQDLKLKCEGLKEKRRSIVSAGLQKEIDCILAKFEKDITICVDTREEKIALKFETAGFRVKCFPPIEGTVSSIWRIEVPEE
jgi:hypothetical protein